MGVRLRVAYLLSGLSLPHQFEASFPKTNYEFRCIMATARIQSQSG